MQVIKQQTTMRHAFCNMKIKPSQQKTHGSIISAAIKSAEHDAGVKNVRDFNAHLKLKTYNELHSKGIM